MCGIYIISVLVLKRLVGTKFCEIRGVFCWWMRGCGKLGLDFLKNVWYNREGRILTIKRKESMKRQDKYPNTNIFTYENINPKNRITGDCEIRAIAKATKMSWEKVVCGLAEIGIETGYSPFVVESYGLFLERQGFKKMRQPRHLDRTKYTLREFIAEHPRGVYVVNMPNHLTVVVNGKNYDIWDCTKSSRKIGNYWAK